MKQERTMYFFHVGYVMNVCSSGISMCATFLVDEKFRANVGKTCRNRIRFCGFEACRTGSKSTPRSRTRRDSTPRSIVEVSRLRHDIFQFFWGTLVSKRTVVPDARQNARTKNLNSLKAHMEEMLECAMWICCIFDSDYVCTPVQRRATSPTHGPVQVNTPPPAVPTSKAEMKRA